MFYFTHKPHRHGVTIVYHQSKSSNNNKICDELLQPIYESRVFFLLTVPKKIELCEEMVATYNALSFKVAFTIHAGKSKKEEQKKNNVSSYMIIICELCILIYENSIKQEKEAKKYIIHTYTHAKNNISVMNRNV